jgi:hypothetical protein
MVNINTFDVLLMLLLLVGAVWAAFQGTTRLLIAVFSLYVALVATLLLYMPLANFFRRLMPAFSAAGSQALAFAIIIFVVFNGLSLLTRFATTPADQRKQRRRRPLAEMAEDASRSWLQRYVLGPLNIVVSFAIGLVIMLAVLALALVVLQSIVESQVAVGGIGASLRYQLKTSGLLPMFNVILYLVYRSVNIWLPGSEVPAIFAKIVLP